MREASIRFRDGMLTILPFLDGFAMRLLQAQRILRIRGSAQTGNFGLECMFLDGETLQVGLQPAQLGERTITLGLRCQHFVHRSFVFLVRRENLVRSPVGEDFGIVDCDSRQKFSTAARPILRRCSRVRSALKVAEFLDDQSQ